MRPALRKPLLSVHVWAGLTIGLVLVVIAVTGAMLVFRPQLERRLDPHRFIVAPGERRLSLDDLVARSRIAHPTAELESVRFYGDPTAPVLVYYSNRDYVHMNPYTGTVLGVRSRYGEGYGWIEGLHKYVQLEPGIGETFNGSLAIVFIGIILTGVVLWWPATRRALKAGLTINPKLKGRPWHLNLHKALGIYCAGVLLLSATTGMLIAFDPLKELLYPLTGSKKILPPVRPEASGSFAGFEAMARSLDALMPKATETYIALPKKNVVSSYAIAADAPHPNARSYVWFDPSTAKPLKTRPYAEAGAGFQLYYWLLSLHTAMLGGWFMRVVLLLGCAGVPVLAYTGTASYLRRKFGRTSAKPSLVRAEIPASAGLPQPVARRGGSA